MSWTITPAGSAFPAAVERWDRCNRDWHGDHPLLDSAFVSPLVSCFAEPGLVLAEESEGDRVKNLLLIHPRRRWVWTTFSPSQAQIAPVLIRSPQTLQELLRLLPGPCAMLDLLCQDPELGVFAIGSTAAWIGVRHHARTMSIDQNEGFEAYWGSRPKKLRQNLGRYERRAARDYGDLEFRVLTGEESVSEGLRRYGDLEARGWKGEIGTAVAPGSLQAAFYAEVLTGFVRREQAFVYELWIGGRLAASRIAIRGRKMLVMLKTTYDESMSKCAPGRILLRRTLRHEFQHRDRGVIEFYTDANRDLIDWSTRDRDVSHITLYRSAAVRRAHYVVCGLRSRWASRGETGQTQGESGGR